MVPLSGTMVRFDRRGTGRGGRWRGCRVAAAVAVALVLTAPAAAGAVPASTDDGRPGAGRVWEAGEVIVRLTPSLDDAGRRRILAAAGATPAWRMSLPGVQVVTATRRAGVAATVAALRRQAGVVWAQPNWTRTAPPEPRPLSTPAAPPAPGARAAPAARVPTTRASAPPPPVNDPFYPGNWLHRWWLFGDDRKGQGQWGLRRIGVDQAWTALKQGNRWLDTRVAVVDTGMDTRHPDLIGKRFLEVPKTARFFAGTPKAVPVRTSAALFANDRHEEANTHGTEVTGVIAATADDGIGMAGVNPRTEVLSLASDDAATDAEAVLYAAAQGATIINWSAAYDTPELSGVPTVFGPDADPDGSLLVDALQKVEKQGVLFVAAAGNESADVQGPLNGRFTEFSVPVYSLPCHDSAQIPNLLCVASTDGSEKLSKFSNWGTPEVDIAAPGSKIVAPVLSGIEYSQISKSQRKSPWAIDNGTSLAAPIVTGAFSLLEACVGPMLRQEAARAGAKYYRVLLDAMRDHGIRREFPGSRRGQTKQPLAGKVTWGGRLDLGLLFDHYGPMYRERPAAP